jgi:hypothetical protein
MKNNSKHLIKAWLDQVLIDDLGVYRLQLLALLACEVFNVFQLAQSKTSIL